MQVVKGSAKPKQNNTEQTISNEEIAKNLYIRAIIDKRKVYKGEQVTVVYKLYTRLTIAAQMSINKLPQYQGFWAEELETASNITFKTEVINGKQFRIGNLKKVALFPSQTGKLEVTPFELTVPVQIQRKRSRNIFDDFLVIRSEGERRLNIKLFPTQLKLMYFLFQLKVNPKIFMVL